MTALASNAVEPPESLAALAQRHYVSGDFNRKPPSYLESYRRLFEGRRDAALRVLEIGVASGASLLLWRDYLPRATIVGVDIGDPPSCIEDQDRIHYIKGSQGDLAVLDRAAALTAGAFDVIIDDASHIGYLTKRSFQYLFPEVLVPGGTYVIEDFGTGFLPAYPDGAPFADPDWNDAVEGAVVFQSSQNGMVGFIKQLVEPMMEELIAGTRPYLPIERLTIETNVAFVEKSLRPGRPAPAMPDLHTPPKPAPKTMDQHVQETLNEHAARIVNLELQVDSWRRALGPLRRVRRLFRRPPVEEDSAAGAGR